MNAKVEPEEGGRLDGLKWLVTFLLTGGALGGFYYYADQSLLMRVIALLVILGMAAFVAFQTEKGRFALGFMGEARTELRKVVWPARKETVQTTLIVIVMVTLMALLLWFLDFVLAWAVRSIIGYGG